MKEFFDSIPKGTILAVTIAIIAVTYIAGAISRYVKGKNNVLTTQEDIKKGSKVVLSCGIYGTLVKVGKYSCEVEIAKGIVIEVDRFAIGKVLNNQEIMALNEMKKKDAQNLKEEKKAKEEKEEN